MTEAPKICVYCDGKGNSTAGGACGFCDNGKPLDTQADWVRTWGSIAWEGRTVSPVDPKLRCDSCKREFKSEKALTVHLARWCPWNACPLCGHRGRPKGCWSHFL